MRENRKAIDWTPYLESVCQKYAHWRELYTFTDAEEEKSRSPKDSFLLDLRVGTVANERQQTGEKEEKTERFAVLEGLRKYAPNHVLLVGRPGSGKSTALARLLWEEAKANLEPLPQPLSYKEREVRIPILVELRYYQTSIFDLILDFLQRHELPCDRDTLESILIQQSCLLLFDGINELPSEEARRDLQQFRQKYAKVPAIFTTRDIGLGGDLNLEKKLEMLPLTEPQMRKFVCTYLPEAGEQMLKKLGTRLKEFGQTPLLLWMLCSVFKSNGNQIPANLGLVFRLFTEEFDIRKREKEGVKVSGKLRRWQKRLLQHLAWVMTTGETPTEIGLSISRSKAEEILVEFLQDKVAYSDDCALEWLEDLLRYYLIQLTPDKQSIEFCHQLIQEYYTAEALSPQLQNLSDEELQWEYLNYLKWTEPVALMLGMLEDKDKDNAIRAVKLALSVDLRLGARLAGEVKPEWQSATVDLILKLNLPQLLSIKLLAATRSKTAIEELIKALEDPASDVRSSAASALGKIGSDAAIIQLTSRLQNPEWITLNNGDTFSNAIEPLEAIQNKLKYYSPIYKVMNRQVYISYNWQEDSNEMADRLVAAFEAKGITIIRDKTHTTYKDSIKNFMRQLGQGKCVVVVISDKYLKSENCMFELVEIAKHGEFRNRIFPVVLKDARFYKATERLNYVRYWEERIKELETAMKSGGLANLQGITDDLNLYQEIRNSIASLTDILRDMNTLTPDLHLESGFQEIIQAVETKLIEDNQKITPTPNTPTAQPSSSSPNVVQNFYGNVNGVAGNVQGNLQVN